MAQRAVELTLRDGRTETGQAVPRPVKLQRVSVDSGSQLEDSTYTESIDTDTFSMLARRL